MAKADDELDQTASAVPRAPVPGARHAFLLVLAGPQFGDVFPLPDGRELLVGRADQAQIQLRDEGVSRRHLTVRVDGATAEVKDLGSQNGTWVNGSRRATARLADGDRVQLGAATILQYVHADELEARFQLEIAVGALQDPLTGLYNRRHLEDRLSSELSAARRHGRPLSVLLVDVDHFKAVNDRHGHLVGDDALRMLALALRGAVRREDVLARYGGEEFLVLARETGADGARVLGERIRAAVETARVRFDDVELALTVSVGVSVSEGDGRYEPGRSERELIEAADRAMYEAKRQGRNRVVVAPAPGSPAAGARRP
jgi:diguanylate cyclase (GGDEF)-like protein